MRQLTLLLLMLFSYWNVQSQPHYNDWIDYSKTYYKFKVHKDGIYRIDQSALQAAGLGSASGDELKLYYKGQEIPLYVTTNGSMGSNDYIEFFGEQNDGEFDTQLFEDPSWQLTEMSSLFTDTSRYYLTTAAAGGDRYQDSPNVIPNSPPPPETFFLHEAIKIHNNGPSSGRPDRFPGTNYFFADFEEGEGFVSSTIPNTFANTNSASFPISTPSIYTGSGAPNAKLESRVAGRNNDFTVLEEHHVQVEVNGQLYLDDKFADFDLKSMSANTVFLNNLSSPFTNVSYIAVEDISNEMLFSVVTTKLTYPHSFDFDNQKAYHFTLANSAQKYLEITNFSGGFNPILYDLTNHRRMTPDVDASTGALRFLLPQESNTTQKRDLVLVNTNTNDPFAGVKLIEDLAEVTFTDYSQPQNQGDFILISHPILRAGSTDWVQEYADYRASQDGGGHTVIVADIEELYDQFAWGIAKTPLAIRHFTDLAIDNWTTKPKYLLLLGKSVLYTRTRFNPLAFEDCMIPTYGSTASDNVLSSPETGSYETRLAVGRVSAMEADQVRAYLEKLIEYENPELSCNRDERGWEKNVLHIVLGKGESQEVEFKSYVDDYKDIIEEPLFGGTVVNTYTTDQSLSNVNVNFPGFATDLENGLGLITLMGHSQEAGQWDFQVGAPESYDNEGKYPFILSGSCFVGNIHNANSVSQAEEFVLSDNHGAIGFLATVSFGFPSILDVYCNEFYDQISVNSYGQPVGDAILETLNNIYISDPNDPAYKGIRATSEEYTLEGDPAVILAGAYDKPEFVLEQNNNYQDVLVYDLNGQFLTGNPITLQDVNDVEFRVNVTNIGRIVTSDIIITITRTLPDGTVQTVAQETVPAPQNEQVYSIIVNDIDPENTEGLSTFAISVDSADTYDEDCEDNNEVILQMSIQSAGCSGLTPPTIATIATTYCSDDPVVSLSATPTGGSFTVDNNPATVFDPSSVSAGNHLITYRYTDPVTDCELASSVSVSVAAVPTAAIQQISSTDICVGSPITIQAVNTNNATYNWDFAGAAVGGADEGPYTLSWATPGTKQITLQVVKDGCESDILTTSINVDASIAAPEVVCSSTESSVAFSWSSISGAEGYQIFINSQNAQDLDPTVTSFNIADLEPGEAVEFRIVTLNSGACGNSTTSLINCQAQNCANINPTIEGLQNTYCVGDGAVELSGNPAGGVFTINGQVATEFEALAPGNFNINYTYEEGSCSYSAPVKSIIVNDTPTPSIQGDNLLCDTEIATLSLDQNYTAYLWSNSEVSPTIDAATAGQYCVTVTNVNGCQGVNCFTVENAPAQTVEVAAVGGVSVICAFGDQLTLVASGGFESYSWSSSPVSEPTLTISAAGNYSVTVTDINGCEWSSGIEITESSIAPPSILSNGTVVGSPSLCTGETLQLDAGAYATYLWSNGSSDQTIDVTSEGTYSVTVTNEFNCEAQSSITVTEGALNPTAILINGQTNASATLCPNEEATLDAGDYASYLWDDGSTGQTTTVTGAGIYFVTVTNAANCAGQTQIVIGERTLAAPAIFADGETAPITDGLHDFCTGNTTTLDAGDYTAYLWSDGSTDQTLNVAAAGNYSVTVTNDLGCQSSVEIKVDEKSVTTPSIAASRTDGLICEGDVLTLTAGGDTYASYEWNGVLGADTLAVTEAGEYTLAVTAENGCSSSATFSIGIDPKSQPSVSISAVQNTSICSGDALVFESDADSTVNVSGLTWIFTNQDTGEEIIKEEDNTALNFDNAGSYSVTLRGAAECGTAIAEQTISNYIYVGETPDVVVTVDSLTACPGDEFTLESDGFADTYSWAFDGEFVGSDASFTNQALIEGVYSLTTVIGNDTACAKTQAVTFSFGEECTFELPNAITPSNKDGFNDYWKVPYAYNNSNIRVEIYNRWGQQVFSTSGYENGDGCLKCFKGNNSDGDELAEGTYYYVLYLNDGASEPVGGHITILR